MFIEMVWVLGKRWLVFFHHGIFLRFSPWPVKKTMESMTIPVPNIDSCFPSWKMTISNQRSLYHKLGLLKPTKINERHLRVWFQWAIVHLHERHLHHPLYLGCLEQPCKSTYLKFAESMITGLFSGNSMELNWNSWDILFKGSDCGYGLHFVAKTLPVMEHFPVMEYFPFWDELCDIYIYK